MKMTRRKRRPSRKQNQDPPPGPDPGLNLAPDHGLAPNQSPDHAPNHALLQDHVHVQNPSRGHDQHHLARDQQHRQDQGLAQNLDQGHAPNQDQSLYPDLSLGLNQDPDLVLLVNLGLDPIQGLNRVAAQAPGVDLDPRARRDHAVLLLNQTNINILFNYRCIKRSGVIILLRI